jgi:tape measure domain-containing protein
MAGVNIKVRADARQATAEMSKLSRSISSIDKQAKSVTSTFQKLAIGITAAFAASGVTKGIVNASDAMTNMGNRVNLVTRDMKQTNLVMKELFSIAARSRSDVGAAADTFSRFGLALKDQNKPLKELLVVTEAVQKAGVISGSSSESAKAAIVQLGQGLASGQLRGQELNSVLEQMPRLAQAIAEGMGIPFGKLRESAMAGLVTAEAVYDAIIKGAQDIDDEYLLLKATVGGLATVFKNEFTRAISELDKVVGTSALIKRGILAATNAVRSFGENISTWALIVDTQFLLLSGRIRFFVEDTKTFLGDLFTGNLDGEQLANNVLGSLDKLKDKVVKKIADINASIRDFFKSPPKYDEFGDVLNVQPIDVSKGFIKGFDAAILAVTSFVTTISDLFWGLFDSVVGDSSWTGIFDPAHEEKGAASIGNTAKWGKHLIVAKEYIESWVNTLKGVFSNLHKFISTTWETLVGYINTLSFGGINAESLSAGFDDAVERMKDTWDNFRKFLTTKTIQTGQGPEEVETSFGKGLREVGTLWDSIVKNMSTRWDSFYDFLTTKEIEVPGGIVKVETEFGKTLRRMKEGYDSLFKTLFSSNQGTDYEVAAGLVPEASESELLTSLKGRVDSISAALAATPIVIGIELLGRNLLNNLGNIRDNIIEFFDANKNIMAAAISVGFSVALTAALNDNFRKMVLRGGIITAVIAAAGSLGNEPKFVEAAKNVAQGLGEAIRKVFEGGDGDFIGSLGKGLITLAKELGKSFIDGLFPTATISSFDPFGDAIEIKNPQFDEFGNEVRNNLLDSLGGVFVGLAAALLISPKIVMFMSKLALGMSMKIGRSFLSAKSVGFIRDGISVGMIRSGKLSSRSKKFQTGFENAGILAGQAMRGGLLAANAATMGLLAQQMTDALVPDDSLGGAGEALDGAALGAIALGQVGMAFGPLGAAIGLAVGGAVGFAFDVYNNEELRQKFADIAQAAKDWFLDLPETVGTAVTSGFEIAWNYLAGKLATIKDFFDFGASADNPATNFPLRLPGETPQEQMIRTGNRFNSGGAVNGPGTGTSDDIPAMLSNGEYVIKASSVSKFGPDFMAAINAGKMPVHRNAGGGIGILPSLEGLPSFKETLSAMSGFENPKRLLGYMGGLLTQGNESTNDALLTGFFRDKTASGRLKNLFTGKADPSVYETVGAGAVSLLETLITAMGVGAIPGVGPFLAMFTTLPDLLLQPLQGMAKFFRQTGWGGNGFAGGVLDTLIEAHTVGDLKSIVTGPVSDLAGLASSTISDLGSRFKGFLGFNSGGAVNGPGTGTSDDIPAMLSNGEFVMQQSAVQKFGPGFMAKINAGIMPIGRASGGLSGQIEQVRAAREVALARGDNVGKLEAFRLETQLRKLVNASEAQLAILEDASSSDEAVAKVVGDLDATKARAELAESYAEGFKDDFKTSLSNLLKTGDFKEFFSSVLDSFTSRVIDSFVDGFVDSLFKGLTGEGGWLTKLFAGTTAFGDGIGEKTASGLSDALKGQEGEGGVLSSISGFFSKMFQGIGDMFKGGGAGGGFLSGLLGTGGGGGLFSSIFGSSFGSIFGFSQGGTVPSTPFSQAGKDSVPAMLMPGEVVLSKNAVSRMGNSGGGSTQQFNINVSGDVSRQTRKEIVKMMPQIASGVNMNNKENNFRRS